MTKKLPKFASDSDAEALLEQDLSEYLTKDNLFAVNFEFLPKDQKVSLRLSGKFMTAIKDAANKQVISYQKYIRMSVERAIRQDMTAQ